MPRPRKPARRTRASAPVQIASAVIAKLSARGPAKPGARKRGALSHPAARGKAPQRPGRGSLAGAVASVVARRLSGPAAKPATTGARRRPSLAAAVASAVSRKLSKGPRASARRR